MAAVLDSGRNVGAVVPGGSHVGALASPVLAQVAELESFKAVGGEAGSGGGAGRRALSVAKPTMVAQVRRCV